MNKLNVIVLVLGLLFWLANFLLALSLCKAAALADTAMERFMEERRKETQ